MKTFVPVLPFLVVNEVWSVLRDDREDSTPEPPKAGEEPEEPGEPEGECPFWTCFIENPRSKNSK